MTTTPTPKDVRDSQVSRDEAKTEKHDEDTTFIRKVNGDRVTTDEYNKDPE